MRCDEPDRIAPNATERAGLIFLAQRLEELTSPRSLDSYKAYAVNVPTLLDEAIEQIEAIQGGGTGISPSSADHILEELAKRVVGNLVCASMVRHERDLAQRIRAAQPTEILGMLKQLRQELAGWAYATQVMSLIISDFASKNKSKLDFLAGELVTTLVNLGMSRRHIHESVTKFFWDGEKDVNSPEDIRRLFRIIFPHYHDFNIYFIIKNKISTLEDREYKSFKVNFIKELPDNLIEAGAHEVFSIKEGRQIVAVSDIKAFDCHSAIELASKKINLIQNLFRMYNHEARFGFQELVLSEQCCANGYRAVRPEIYINRPVTDTSKPIATQRLNNLVADSKFLRGRHYDKFVSVSEFHGHSLESSSLENKLLNLWISLETISPSKRGLSKIDNVIQSTYPVFGLVYLKRIVSALHHDLLIWDRAKIRTSLENIEGEISEPSRLLLLLSQPGSQQVLSELLTDMDGQELLRNRIFRISKILSSKKNILESIDSHVNRVNWQLRRIYRARNQIVHLGKVPAFVSSLVDSAHDYFDQLLTITAEISIGPNGFSDFDASFEFLDSEYRAYRRAIDNIDFDSPQSVQKLLWQRVRAISRYDVLQAGPH